MGAKYHIRFSFAINVEGVARVLASDF